MSRWFTQVCMIFRSIMRRDRLDHELDEELQYHLERLIDDGLAKGLPPEDAQYAARRAMGAIAKSKDECRDMRGLNFIEDLMRDLRYAWRSLRRNPGFAALAVLIMGFGIGANTAVFSVVNAVLLKPLPYRDPDRIVTISDITKGEIPGAISEQIAIPDLQDWRDQSSSFEAMGYYGSRESPVTAGSTAEYARATAVGPGFFRVFAVEPMIGRFFTAEEMKPDSAGAVMISYAYWQRHFGGDPRALGQTVRVYGSPLPIAGVLPPGFGFPDNTDVWGPWVSSQDLTSRLGQNWLAVGRLKPGVRPERAQTEMTVIARRLERQYPESNKNRTVLLMRLQDEMVGDTRPTLYLLLGVVGMVLLIACANTAILLLAKATARTHEIAVRVALGASRRRIVRQLIAESSLLALLAGGSGLLLALGASKALVALAPASLPRLTEIGIDRWVLGFTLGVSLATSLLFGLIPALHASKVDLNGALKHSGNRSVIAGGMVRMRGMLVVAEIALAVPLVAGTALLIKSLIVLHKVTLGYQPENVLVMRATVPIPMQARAASGFFKDLLPRVAHVPGVLSAGATMAPPGSIESSGGYFIDHLPAKPDWNSAPEAVLSVVAPGTFAALGIPLKSGRDFNDGDTAGRPAVAIVNEALVRESFPGQNPIGRTIFCPFDSLNGMTIIGIAGDVRQGGPASQPMPECDMTYQQHGFNGNTLSIVARTSGDPDTFVETLRRLVRETSPDVPMKFTTMEARLSESVAAPRIRSLLFAIFAGLAVGLSMAGVYGAMAYAVSQRSNEIGLRIALGAGKTSVFRLIMGQGIILSGVGVALGLAAAIAGTRLLTSVLFQVQPNDPLVYLAVVALMGVMALVASYVPARSACKIDPMTTLRQE